MADLSNYTDEGLEALIMKIQEEKESRRVLVLLREIRNFGTRSLISIYENIFSLLRRTPNPFLRTKGQGDIDDELYNRWLESRTMEDIDGWMRNGLPNRHQKRREIAKMLDDDMDEYWRQSH